MKNISFDFDGTLSFIDMDGKECMFHIQNFCKALVQEKIHEIFIITRRNSFDPQETFEVFNLAARLGIKKENVIFTNREYKYGTIKQLDIHVHIDDDWDDIDRIHKHTTCKAAWSLDREVELKFANLNNE